MDSRSQNLGLVLFGATKFNLLQGPKLYTVTNALQPSVVQHHR
jgi:hypothetical protein